MNRKIYRTLFYLLLISTAGACKKSALLTYNAPDNIYFDYRTRVDLATGSKGFVQDSLDYTFSFSAPDITDAVIPIPLLVAGKPAAKDRSVNLVLDPASTAVSGKHFELPNPVVIHAGNTADTVWLRLKRDPELKSKQVTMIFRLQPNENFGTEMKYKYRDVSASAKDTISVLRLKIKLSDMLVKGPLWDPYMWWFFGDYSEKKIRLMNQIVGMPLSFAANTSYTSDVISMPPFYATLMGRYLREQAANGNTVYEDDGVTAMAMHPDYN